jgi:hypothetical protein
VEALIVSALGKKIPVLESPLGLIDGAAVDPAETVVIPEALIPVTLILGFPESPKEVVAKDAVDAVPVRFPLKVVAVTTPVTTAPSGKIGAAPGVLPFKFVTLKSDIRDLLNSEYQ